MATIKAQDYSFRFRFALGLMSSNFPPRQDHFRGGRLRSFFGRVLAGEQALKSFQNAKLFIEAIYDQPDPVKCVERLISSPKGLSTL